MANVAKQIIGSFEDIGKDIARETFNVPKDIAGKALESLGTTSQKGKQAGQVSQTKPDAVKSQEKPLPPRKWLEELAGSRNRQREPTVQERLEREKQEKNEKDVKKATVEQKMAPLTPVSTKAKRGNLYGIKQKASSEMSKNVRQD